MKNIIFIFSKIGNKDVVPWIPLGILYIISYLRKNNPDFNAILIDSNFEKLDKNNLQKIINTYDPEYIAISAMTIQSTDAIRIGKLIFDINPNIPIVFGGVHFTFKPEDICGNGYVIQGEGELSMSSFLLKKEYKNLDFINDLDTIPFPAYDMINIYKYSDFLITGEKAISIMTGRGCPYNCTFCASPQLWKRNVRFHSVLYLKDHILQLINQYNLRNLRIMDDTFCTNKNRVIEFCEMILKNNYNLNMTCLTHIKTADQEMFKIMKQAGFSIVAFGIESGSSKILNNINKNITVEEIEYVVDLAKNAGLKTECLFMIGNIGETNETIQESINLKNKIKSDWSWFQYAVPFPGSKFHDNYLEYGTLTTTDYLEYDHQKPIFVPNGTTVLEMNQWLNKCNEN